MREAEKKREKLLHLSTWVSTTRYSSIKGAVSADGDGKRSSGVDDLAHNEPPSQVLALTSGVICGCMFHMVSSLYSKGRSQSLLR